MQTHDLPREYSYNPKKITMILCAVLFAGGAAVFVNMAVTNDRGLILEHMITLDTGGATNFYWTFAALAASFVVVAIMAVIRGTINPKLLRLDTNSITLPHGILQMKTTRLAYSDIDSVSETTVSRQKFLYLHTKQGRFALTRSLLPNDRNYEEIKEFLVAKTDGR